jgi:hypothetical protein
MRAYASKREGVVADLRRHGAERKAAFNGVLEGRKWAEKNPDKLRGSDRS